MNVCYARSVVFVNRNGEALAHSPGTTVSSSASRSLLISPVAVPAEPACQLHDLPGGQVKGVIVKWSSPCRGNARRHLPLALSSQRTAPIIWTGSSWEPVHYSGTSQRKVRNSVLAGPPDLTVDRTGACRATSSASLSPIGESSGMGML